MPVITQNSWMSRSVIRPLLFSVMLVLATVAAYYPAWHGQPIWDDDAHLTAPDLRSLEGLGRIWTEPGATQQYYPLVHTVFWIEQKLWDQSPFPYHLLNILLHAGAALLLLAILQQLAVPGAWLAAGIFALHPIEVESVAWISELKNTLSGVLFLCAILVYLRFEQSRSRKAYAIALVAFIFGLLCKTAIAPMPVVLLAIFWWQRGAISWRRDVVPLLPFFIIGTSFGLTTAWIETNLIGAVGNDFHFGILERILIAGRTFWFYLAKILWPTNLVFIYPRWQIALSSWWQFLFPVAAVLFFAFLFALRRRGRGPLAAMVIFGALIFPASGFFNVYPFIFSFVADHFQYFAGIAAIALGAAALSGMARRMRFSLPLRCVSSAALLLVLGVLTWRQCLAYADPETFYQTILRKNPDCWMAYNNLGLVFARQGRMNEAEAEYDHALAIRPRFAEPHINLGAMDGQLGRSSEAVSHLQQALEIDPNNGDAHLNLGNTFLTMGRFDDAIAECRTATELRSHRSRMWYGVAEFDLANALRSGNYLEQAIVHYRRAADLAPDVAAIHNNLSKALFADNKLEEAGREYQKWVQLSRPPRNKIPIRPNLNKSGTGRLP